MSSLTADQLAHRRVIHAQAVAAGSDVPPHLRLANAVLAGACAAQVVTARAADTLLVAFDRGESANFEGALRHDNPYSKLSALRQQWDAGWDRAQALREQWAAICDGD